MGGGGRWGAEHHTLEQKSSHCLINEVQKGAQCTYQAEMVIGNSLAPTKFSLIVCPMQWHCAPHSGLLSIYKVTKMIIVKALSLLCLDSRAQTNLVEFEHSFERTNKRSNAV